jgi:F-type H+-transporting ATPase subunit b
VRAIQAEVGQLAVELAGRVVGESLEDEALRRRTVERFLADLESGAVTVSGSVPGGAGQ